MSKLILTHEVTGLGSAGDIVEVKNGYARNYLIPQGFAVQWSRGGQKQVDQIKTARVARELATLEEAQALKSKLEASPIKLTVTAGREGRLFGSVKTGDIVDAVEAAGLGSLDKRTIELVGSDQGRRPARGDGASAHRRRRDDHARGRRRQVAIICRWRRILRGAPLLLYLGFCQGFRSTLAFRFAHSCAQVTSLKPQPSIGTLNMFLHTACEEEKPWSAAPPEANPTFSPQASPHFLHTADGVSRQLPPGLSTGSVVGVPGAP